MPHLQRTSPAPRRRIILAKSKSGLARSKRRASAKFYLFSFLPPEVRLAIWNAAFSEPVVVAVTQDTEPDSYRLVRATPANEAPHANLEAWHEWTRTAVCTSTALGSPTPTQRFLRLDLRQTVFFLDQTADMVEGLRLLVKDGVPIHNVALLLLHKQPVIAALERMVDVDTLETVLALIPKADTDTRQTWRDTALMMWIGAASSDTRKSQALPACELSHYIKLLSWGRDARHVAEDKPSKTIRLLAHRVFKS